MYRRCTFCTAHLGTNEVVEAFPVGRRLAFDGARGRLWVICQACERWNLTPLEERWEALEEAERTFRSCRLRAFTGQIGLARHREGLDLVRIGEPARPEFAAWRYGDRFGRRRRRFVAHAGGALLVTGIGVGVVAGSGVLAGSTGVGWVVFQGFQLAGGLRQSLATALRLPLDDGRELRLRAKHLGAVRLRAGPAPGTDVGPQTVPLWHLRVSHREGRTVLAGDEAVRALRRVLPHLNRTGASRRGVRAAVAELEEVGGPEAYFAAAEARARLWASHAGLSGLPHRIRLALEMAAHEDFERVALEGELTWLEQAWREAEEIAAIADSLALPDRVRLRFEELQARFGRVREPEEGGRSQ